MWCSFPPRERIGSAATSSSGGVAASRHLAVTGAVYSPSPGPAARCYSRRHDGGIRDDAALDSTLRWVPRAARSRPAPGHSPEEGAGPAGLPGHAPGPGLSPGFAGRASLVGHDRRTRPAQPPPNSVRPAPGGRPGPVHRGRRAGRPAGDRGGCGRRGLRARRGTGHARGAPGGGGPVPGRAARGTPHRRGTTGWRRSGNGRGSSC